MGYWHCPFSPPSPPLWNSVILCSSPTQLLVLTVVREFSCCVVMLLLFYFLPYLLHEGRDHFLPISVLLASCLVLAHSRHFADTWIYNHNYCIWSVFLIFVVLTQTPKPKDLYHLLRGFQRMYTWGLGSSHMPELMNTLLAHVNLGLWAAREKVTPPA